MVKAMVLLVIMIVVAVPLYAAFVRERFRGAVQPFDLKDVRLLDGVFKDAQEANRRYLHHLDANRLLHNFRVNANLKSEAQPLGGWEAPSCEVRGHFVGHYLSACALMYASTGDEQLKAKADNIVAEMAKVQKALGGGYLSAFPETFFDRLESLQNIPWAPYYTIHKIMAGLFDMYQLADNQQALEVLKNMADYFKGRIDKLSDVQFDRTLDVEFGGMSEVLLNLYSVTGDTKYFRLAQRFHKAAFLGPLALEHDNLTGLHANTHLPQISGAARYYELTGDERYCTIVQYFWHLVRKTRTYATGGTSSAEHWPEPHRLAKTLSSSNQECCTTYNFLKITRYLFRWTADPQYADFYERALFNSILGTQNPKTGMLLYFVPLKTGFSKSFGTPEDSFWCCYGTGIESFSKLGDSIYFHDDKSLYVNLFIASTVKWKEKGIILTQETNFPEKPDTKLIVHTDKRKITFTLRIRVPCWARNGVEARLNGKLLEVRLKPGTYFAIKRQWSDGDTVQVEMPMRLYTEPLPDDPELVAILYGPLVLAGLTEKETYFLGDAKRPERWLKPVAGSSLTFKTTGQSAEVTFIPLYRVMEERYGVHFVVTPKGSERHQKMLLEEEARQQRQARMVDYVNIGDEASERIHNLAGERTESGELFGKRWRHAVSGGFFEYTLKVEPKGQMILAVVYWGSDVPPRKFDIMVEGETIATQELNRNRPDEFFEVEYPIPLELTEGKQSIKARFRAHESNLAGGIFGLAVLRQPEKRE